MTGITLPVCASLVILAMGCGGPRDEPACWAAYNEQAADCSSQGFSCQRQVETDADQQACNEVVESCGVEAQDALLTCAGEQGCLADWLTCDDVCDHAFCMDDCWDALEGCAGWWATDCQQACADNASACIDETLGIVDQVEALDAQSACMDTYYRDCVPGCYTLE